MKKYILGITLAATAMTANASNYSFSNVSFNSLNWTNETSDKTPHLKDFNFIELEGGIGYDNVDLYGFVDIENFDNYNSLSDVELSMKGVAAVKTGVDNVKSYNQVFIVTNPRYASC